LESCQHQGIGQQLFKTFVTDLVRQGFASMLLWVLSANQKSCRFYEAMGGHATMTQEFELGGVTLQETGYGWLNLSNKATT